MSQIGYKRFFILCLGIVLLGCLVAGCNPLNTKQAATKTTAQATKAAPAQTSEMPPPPTQEISVNLLFRGADAVEGGKPQGNLNFDFCALWGEYKRQDAPVTMTASSPKTASLEFSDAKMYIKPRVNRNPYGMYDVQMIDASGRTAGKWTILESGKQIDAVGTPQGYTCDLVRFEPEKRITAYLISKPRPGYAKGDPQWGVVFVGKGWSWVENSTAPDMSKGYLFPEVDIIVLPKAWFADKDYADALDRLKGGTPVGDGLSVYS